jgi:tetratricopeptide (TPR) repeat protein
MNLMIVMVLCVGTAASDAEWLDEVANDLKGLRLEATSRQNLDSAHKSVQQAPANAVAWGRFGQLLYVHDLVEYARHAYEIAEKLRPDDYRWPYYLAVSYEAKDVARASALFARAVALGGPVHIDLARSLFKQGELAEAITFFHQLCADDLHHGCLGVAQVLFAQGRYRRSRVFAELALHLSETNSDLYLLLSRLHTLSGEGEQAEIFLQRARDLGPGRRPSNPLRDVLSALRGEPVSRPVKPSGTTGLMKASATLWLRDAELLMEAGRPASAVVSYRAAIAHDRESAPARLGLAYALLHLGQGREARRIAQSLIVEDRKNAQYQMLLREALD